MDALPRAVVIAGPNGAGKSTAAPMLLESLSRPIEFVNADEIALRNPDPVSDCSKIQAGRVMLKRLKELTSERADLAFETTLASRSFAPWLRSIQKADGYEVYLFFLWLPSAEQAIDRVCDRVRRGGHDIAEDVIRRRYRRGLANLFDLYIPLAQQWTIYNASDALPEPVAFAGNGGIMRILSTADWDAIQASIP